MLRSPHSFAHAFAGGALIGLGTLIALLASGTIPGMSGLFSKLLRNPAQDSGWRPLFFGGVIAGAAILFAGVDSASTFRPVASLPTLAIAGVLVGFGTRLGGGCTSGHGICGIGLGSRSSLVATALFMAAGMATVWACRHLGGLHP